MTDWRTLFQRTQRELSAAARRRGLSPDAAEDASQDAFLRLMTATAGGERAVLNPRAYLHQTVRNLVTDARRRDRAAPFAADADTAIAMVADDAPSPEQRASDRQRLSRAQAVIDALPERTRRAFEMHRLEGRTLSDIGRELDLSTTRVWALVREAYGRVSDGDVDLSDA